MCTANKAGLCCVVREAWPSPLVKESGIGVHEYHALRVCCGALRRERPARAVDAVHHVLQLMLGFVVLKRDVLRVRMFAGQELQVSKGREEKRV